ncbi:hypothetical protein BDW62DRAFT_198632 [Aspergillus aurantiobrunneus]
MSSDLPSVNELRGAVETGLRITPEDVSVIRQIESELTGGEQIQGESLATAQRLAIRQMDFDDKLDELSQKPQSHITQEDALEIEELEDRAFNKPPGPGSISAQVRSIANRNLAFGLPAASVDAPAAYVTKDDARDAQHEESMIYGGQNPRGGMAARMQSAADKLEHARRES